MTNRVSAHSARRGTERSQEPLTPRRAGLRCALSQWRAALTRSTRPPCRLPCIEGWESPPNGWPAGAPKTIHLHRSAKFAFSRYLSWQFAQAVVSASAAAKMLS